MPEGEQGSAHIVTAKFDRRLTQDALLGVPQLEVLVGELLAVDGLSTSS
jgi:hypothetical protein